jgi:Tol biopolymer transport system component
VAYEWWKANSDHEIRIADVNGSNQRTIAKSEGEVMAWTPDQKQLLIRWSTGPLTAERAGHFGMVDVATGAVRKIADFPGRLPRRCILSPDGKWIAYDRLASDARGGGGIPTPVQNALYLMPSNGGSPVLLSSGTADEFPLTWTMDGSGLLVESNRGGKPAIWGIPLKDERPQGEPRLVYPSFPWFNFLGSTRTGALFMSDPSSQRAVFEVNFDSATGRPQQPRRTQLSLSELLQEKNYLPDGSATVYAADGKLVVRTPATGRERRVDPSCGEANSVQGIHPNGNSALVVCTSRGPSFLTAREALQRKESQAAQPRVYRQGFYFVNIETGASQTLLTWDDPMALPLNPVITPDGSRVYFGPHPSSPPGKYVSVDVATSAKREEWPESAALGLRINGFSPDGSWMLLSRPAFGAGPNFEMVEIRGSGSIRIPPPGSLKVWPGVEPVWSRDGKWIFFCVLEDGKYKIKRMLATGGDAETVFEGVGGSVPQVAFDPSGSRILIASGSEQLVVWALDNIGRITLR